MARVSSIVAGFKDQPFSFLDEAVIRDACAHEKYTWRQRLLGPTLTVRLMLLQTLHGNVSCRRLTRLAGIAVSVTAYVNARKRLPIDVLGWVLWAVNQNAQQHAAEFGKWLGHRVVLIDGSGVSMPDTPALQKAFGQPGRVREGCGFPVTHTLWLFDATTGLILDFVTGRWSTSDLSESPRLHPAMEEGDVLLGGRAFCSYAHIALLLQENLNAVLRAHQRLLIDFTPGRKARSRRPKGRRRGVPTSTQLESFSKHDQYVKWIKPQEKPRWMEQHEYDQLPHELTVRELRYTVKRRGYRTTTVTLVTTLVDPRKYSRQDLAELYGSRWQIETNLRDLKQTLGMDVLRCKTVEGVKKELLAYAIVYNLVRLSMLVAAKRQGVPPNRLSFIDAMDALRIPQTSSVFYGLVVNPKRPNRDELTPS